MPAYESYVTNTQKTRVTRRGLNRGGKKAKGTSYVAPRRAAAKSPARNRTTAGRRRELEARIKARAIDGDPVHIGDLRRQHHEDAQALLKQGRIQKVEGNLFPKAKRNTKPSKKDEDMATRNGPRTKRRRAARAAAAAKKTTKKKGGSSAGLKKARAVRGAMKLGVSKETANRLYDAGKLTATGQPKKGARGIPQTMKKKKATKKKAAKKKTAKKKTKKVAKRKTKKVAKKRVKRAAPTRRKKGSARPIKVKRRGTAPTRGCKRAKPGAQSVRSAAKRVQAGKEGRSGTPLAYERWCRNFAQYEKYSEADLAAMS